MTAPLGRRISTPSTRAPSATSIPWAVAAGFDAAVRTYPALLAASVYRPAGRPGTAKRPSASVIAGGKLPAPEAAVTMAFRRGSPVPAASTRPEIDPVPVVGAVVSRRA